MRNKPLQLEDIARILGHSMEAYTTYLHNITLFHTIIMRRSGSNHRRERKL